MGIRSTAALLLGASLLAPAPASAAEASPWTPYRTDDFTAAAGRTCAFELHGEVLEDQERYRTTAWFPDGSPRVQEFTGRLVVRYTNTATGASAVRNLTGRSDFEYFADGGWTLTDVGGHFGAGLHPGDDPGPGFFVVDGSGWAVHADADGHRTLTTGQGTVENLCETLA